MKKSVVLATAIVIASVVCGGNALDTGTYRNNKVTADIKVVQIGTQTWTTENLDVDKFRNGDPILEAKTAEEWTEAMSNGTPAWCFYKFDSGNGKKYGKLYNFYVIEDPRKIAPEGYHLPGNSDIDQLMKLDADKVILAAKLCAANGWGVSMNDEINKNMGISGFNALPGSCNDEMGIFLRNNRADFWMSDSIETVLGYMPGEYGIMKSEFFKGFNAKGAGLAIRLIKD